ncbi:unnamed protein product [Kluyveromyces dobzhanskii CBS 2104]|uniref:WGS project CCBQ000000000 data, contig 00058 n=1 Tax=Kluyveromyces dobzhanskii CBS 2104 TaxID=1427455 RepID=A0A0A8LDV7_9SACH|nr:unnamed protein product [Kluyveromyces dobzhanskii CBS 2104]
MPVEVIEKNLDGNYDTHFYAGQDETGEDGVLRIAKDYREKVAYPDFLPSWDPRQKYPPIKFHKYEDPGLRADPNFPNLLNGKATLKPLTPKIGTKITGIQLTQLSDAAKDELALLIAQRGIVIFENQDFIDKGPGYAEEYGKHFGKLHIHQTSGAPEGYPHLHVTFRRPDRTEFGRVFSDKVTSTGFHTDVSYELQPASYTFFAQLEGPESGGDTLFADTIEAFDRLSPHFQDYLSTLHVIHSSKEQANNSKSQGGIQRRAPVTHIHPLIRVHPVLKKKSIYVNRSFSRKIVELKTPESNVLLDFLYNLVENSHDLQLRAKWEPRTVAVWDNRRLQHSASVDWEDAVTRHNVRITPHGERPVEDLKFYNDPTYYPHKDEDEEINVGGFRPKF